MKHQESCLSYHFPNFGRPKRAVTLVLSQGWGPVCSVILALFDTNQGLGRKIRCTELCREDLGVKAYTPLRLYAGIVEFRVDLSPQERHLEGLPWWLSGKVSI